MKVFITGATGQLGYDVALEVAHRGHFTIASSRHLMDEHTGNQQQQGNEIAEDDITEPAAGISELCCVRLDLTDEIAVKKVIAQLRPDAIIHCAAWTEVDAAENEENRGAVYNANVIATKYLAEAAKEISAKMLYLSTDYVFNGTGSCPWQPDDRSYAPLNEYGKSKLEGELIVSATLERFFIVRTAWMFGKNGRNFVRTMLDLGKRFDMVRVVNDQIGTPTYTKDLAVLLVDMIESERYGYYHATNEGSYISWYDFCCEIYRQTGLTTQVIPVTTEEYGLNKAKRPANSRLDKRKLIEAGFQPLPDWKDALSRYLDEIGEKKEWDRSK